MLDREKAGLRGPVKSCLQDYEYRAPELSFTDRQSTETIYDTEGRLLSTRYIYPGFSDWVSTRSYDEAGRLAKITSGKAGELASETLYAYDEKGRVAEVRTNVKGEELPNGGNRGGVMVAMDFSGDPPGGEIDGLGARVTALHDDLGQWTELSSFDGQGRLRVKSVRKYDANGRIIEESISLENPSLLFIDKIAESSGMKLNDKQQEAMNKGLKLMLAGRKGTGVWYSYDSQGRIAEVCRRNIAVEAITKVSYNEHGDKSEERVTLGPNNVLPAGVSYSFQENDRLIPDRPVPDEPPAPTLECKYLHTYEYRGYDGYGNWTEMTKIEQMGKGEIGPEKLMRNFHRTLAYH